MAILHFFRGLDTRQHCSANFSNILSNIEYCRPRYSSDSKIAVIAEMTLDLSSSANKESCFELEPFDSGFSACHKHHIAYLHILKTDQRQSI